MKKLRLALDSLRVESFATDGRDPRGPGTVKAHADVDTAYRTCGCTYYQETCARTCDCPPTFGDTCINVTCARTCDCPSWSGAECNTVCVG